jgi:hypothetical protein
MGSNLDRGWGFRGAVFNGLASWTRLTYFWGHRCQKAPNRSSLGDSVSNITPVNSHYSHRQYRPVKPRLSTTSSRSVEMIFRNYNLNPVSDTRRRW